MNPDNKHSENTALFILKFQYNRLNSSRTFDSVKPSVCDMGVAYYHNIM